ncbi:MAG: hypothetical protein GYA24_19755 [Candidatus Lokiarchaeota archaeon]|nr:hypothetical protein [Candidatus Lokiarchaeota archaeon]
MFDILGWLLIILAVVFLVLVVLHVESDKSLSLKFTIISVVIASFCIGYGIHFLLLNAGL